jgi:phosphatidylglycerophosphate synthase
MEDGSGVDALNPWGVRMFRTLKATQARSNAEQTAYGNWFDETSDREQARQARVHGAVGIIPGSIWIVLLLSATLIFAYMLFFADSGEYARSQAMLIGSATAIVTVTLLVILALDNPYRPGVGSLEPTAMQRSLVLLDEARAAIDDRSRVPCSASGTPSGS